MYNGNVSFSETNPGVGAVVGTGACLSAGWYGTKAVGEAVVGALKGSPTPVPPTQFEAATMEAAKVLPWATIIIAAVTLINALIAWLEWPVEQLKKGILCILRKLTALVNWLNPINWFGGKKAAAQNAVAVADPVQATADPVQATADPVQATADPAQEATPVQATADPVQEATPVQEAATAPSPSPDSTSANYRGRKKHGR